jgi:acetyl-CoA acetyltransferase
MRRTTLRHNVHNVGPDMRGAWLLIAGAAHELAQRNARYAQYAICIAVGQGVATIIIERV